MEIAQIDPMCESEFGHNIGANICFARNLAQAGFTVEIYASETLGLNNPDTTQFRRQLPSVVGKFQGEEITIAKMSRILRDIDAKILFFPNVDRFTLSALSRITESLRGKKILIRMIGVGESYFHGTDPRYEDGYTPNRFEHFEDLKHIAKRCDVRLCAENEVYRNLIEEQTGLYCDYWPAPTNSRPVSLDQKRDTVFLPGTPRWDKGSNLADELTTAMARHNPSLIFAYQTTNLKTQIDGNRVLLPRFLDTDTYWSWLARSLCVVLPYDKEVYRFRGSASVFDAADMGAFTLTLDGLGFSQEVVQNRIGFVYEDLRELKALDVRETCRSLHPENLTRFNSLREDAIARQLRFLTGDLGAEKELLVNLITH